MRNVRATGPLWAVKTGYIVVSVLFCVLGVVLLVMSERCVPWIGRALGIGMVVCGAIKLGGYFSKDLFRLAFQYDLAFGILLIAVGIITLCHPGEAMSFLCVMFGIPVLADGLFKIQIAVDARRFGIPQWWLVLALAAGDADGRVAAAGRYAEPQRGAVRREGGAASAAGRDRDRRFRDRVREKRERVPAHRRVRRYSFCAGGVGVYARTGDGYPIFVKRTVILPKSKKPLESACAGGSCMVL